MYLANLKQAYDSLVYQFDELDTAFSDPPMDNEYLQDMLTSLIEELSLFHENMVHFSKTANVDFDYWVSIRFDKCYELIGNIHKLLVSNAPLADIKKQMDFAHFLWTDKFEEDFSCWLSTLYSEGVPWCKESTIFLDGKPKKIFLQMLNNALTAEKLYFSISRNRNQSIVRGYSQQFFNNRRTTGATTPVDVQQLSGRRLITANIDAVEMSLANVKPEALLSADAIAGNLAWHKTGSKNWNRETIVRGFLDYQAGQRPLYIKYQHQPVPGQLANMHTSGVGRYGVGGGRTPGILRVFNQLTQKKPEKERALARLMIQYKHGDGRVLTEERLIAAQMHLPVAMGERRKLVERFNKAAYLICFQEVYRRKNQGYRMVNGAPQRVVELPFALAVACALKLIADGHLRMQQVFDADAVFGVFTGTGVMSDNLITTLKKFNQLFTFFAEQYMNHVSDLVEYAFEEGLDESTEYASYAFTPEFFHQQLRSTGDGGHDSGSDSDNENYNEIRLTHPQQQELWDSINQISNQELKTPRFKF
jgi:hypothetical protein